MRKKLLILFVLVAALSIFVVPRAQASDTFPDVPDSHWAHDFITWLFDNGITSGFPDGTYRPDNLVTRAEMAVFLQRVVQSDKVPTPLVIDGIITFNTGSSLTIGEGERGYAEGNVSVEGQLGQPPLVGEFHETFVSTDGIGVGASVGQSVWRIFDEGDIWVTRVFDNTNDPDFEGAIIGGTGRFAGASGQYSATVLSNNPDVVIRATFMFEKPPKPAE